MIHDVGWVSHAETREFSALFERLCSAVRDQREAHKVTGKLFSTL